MTAFGAAILGCEGPHLSKDEAAFFAKVQPFGFILFNRNLVEADQIRALCADLRAAVGWNAPVLIDQEGGRVQRLRPPLAREWAPPLEDVARLGTQAEHAMRLRSQIIALELRGLGIDTNCVPTLDIARDETHPVLRNRCYGETAQDVIAIGRAVVAGHLDGGVMPVMKHMPGHGLATMDSHLDLPRVNASPQSLQDMDFATFRAFADLPLGMSAHLVFEQIDDAPATTSRTMIDLIRSDIGFGGLLMTDDISMQALSGPIPQRGVASLGAGCDVVLHCNGEMDEMRPLMDQIGQMSDAALSRAKQALAQRPTAPQGDIAQLVSEFEALGSWGAC